MRYYYFLLLYLLLPVFSFSFAQGNPPPMTLKEVYFYALENSETIAVSEQVVREAEALYRETLGSSFPDLTFRHAASFADGGEDEDQGMFRVRQTGLSGYRELAAIKADKLTVRQREHEKARAEQLLLADVAEAFYGLLQSRENAGSTAQLKEFAGQRLAELEDRVRVGRTRETDAISQQFQMTTLESQLEEAVRQKDARRDLLSFLAGVPMGDPVLTEMPDEETGLLENYLQKIDERPDVRAALESARAAEASVKVARAEYLPSLDLTFDSFAYRSDSDNADWSASLAVSVPLWDWGSRRGTLDAAKAVLSQEEETLSAARRQADLDIRNAYRDYASAKAQLAFRQKAVELARRDYELQLRDDKQGLVTSLEVLESLDRLNAAELALNSARLTERLASINLELAAGARPEDILR